MTSERQWIERIRALTGSPLDPDLTVPIGDDAAVLRWPTGRQLVLAKDVLTENQHFRRSWTIPEFLAEKSLAVNLSDLAAMGADPRGCLLGLTIPRDLPNRFVDRFLDRFVDSASGWNCPLLGGDLSAGDLLHVSVTVLGSVGETPWRRDGGQPGDCLLLVGEVGLSTCGLRLLERWGSLPESIQTVAALREFCESQGEPSACVEAHLLPRPKLPESAWFAAQGDIHAGIDISDGLTGDIEEIARKCGLTAVLDARAIELLQAAGDVRIQTDDLLSGGEDYALVLALAPAEWERLQAIYPENLSTPSRIGELRKGNPGLAIQRDQRVEPLFARRFDHFP